MDNLKISSISVALLLACVPIVGGRLALGQTSQSESGLLLEQLSLEAMIARQNEYVEGLSSSIRNEKREESWASQQESSLRRSFSSQVGGGLKTIDCRTTRCGIEIDLVASESPQAALDRQIKIMNWISVNTDCGFTLVPGQQLTSMAASKVRIYLDCQRQ